MTQDKILTPSSDTTKMAGDIKKELEKTNEDLIADLLKKQEEILEEVDRIIRQQLNDVIQYASNSIVAINDASSNELLSIAHARKDLAEFIIESITGSKNEIVSLSQKFYSACETIIEDKNEEFSSVVNDASELLSKKVADAINQIDTTSNVSVQNIIDTFKHVIEDISACEKNSLNNIKVYADEKKEEISVRTEEIKKYLGDILEESLSDFENIKTNILESIREQEYTSKAFVRKEGEAAVEKVLSNLDSVLQSMENLKSELSAQLKNETDINVSFMIETLENCKVEILNEKNKCIGEMATSSELLKSDIVKYCNATLEVMAVKIVEFESEADEIKLAKVDEARHMLDGVVEDFIKQKNQVINAFSGEIGDIATAEKSVAISEINKKKENDIAEMNAVKKRLVGESEDEINEFTSEKKSEITAHVEGHSAEINSEVDAHKESITEHTDVELERIHGNGWEGILEAVAGFANELENKAGFHIGPEPPEDTNKIWINTNDDGYSLNPEVDDEYQLLIKAIGVIAKRMDDIEYIYKYSVDAGEFETNEPEETSLEGEYPELEEGYEPDIDTESTKVKHIRIARGSYKDLPNLLEGEMALTTDTMQLCIGTSSGVKIIKNLKDSDGGSGGGNLTAEYIDLLKPNSDEKFRIRMKQNGSFNIYNASDDNRLPNESSSADIVKYKGLIINRGYCGAPVINSESKRKIVPVSHGFIELYNSGVNHLNLKGLSLQYSQKGRDWKVLELDGVIPPKHSFLIRGQQVSDPSLLTTRIKINEYDMEWDIPLFEDGSYTDESGVHVEKYFYRSKFLLKIGTEPCTEQNPFGDPYNLNVDQRVPSVPGYLDMVGVHGTDTNDKTDAQEGLRTRFCMSATTGFERYENGEGHASNPDTLVFTLDHDDNYLDLRKIDYMTVDTELYRPRCVDDGPWDSYTQKAKLEKGRPNMLYITYGEDAHTSRVFTWQTLDSKNGYVKYKKKDDEYYRTVESKKEFLNHHDCTVIVHRAVVSNLTPGKYIYKVGEEGKWSDENEFEVKVYGENDEINFLQTTDQQGFNEFEYEAWKHASRFIMNEHLGEYDFRINTGDISQNGNMAYEWRYYYEHAKDDLVRMAEMTVCGNNDLVDKTYSEAFNYYTTYENSPYPSTYTFTIGDARFTVLNSWAWKDSDITNFANKQLAWLDDVLSGTNPKYPKKRWNIVMMHLAPYTVEQEAKQQFYRDTIEKHAVDVVICGHNHCYSRSKAVMTPGGTTTVDKLNGVYHVMSQATGYKLIGKKRPVTPPQVWVAYATIPVQPSYIMWKITRDYIEFTPYTICDILAKDEVTGEEYYNEPDTLRKELIEPSFKIYHRSVREQHLDEL